MSPAPLTQGSVVLHLSWQPHQVAWPLSLSTNRNLCALQLAFAKELGGRVNHVLVPSLTRFPPPSFRVFGLNSPTSTICGFFSLQQMGPTTDSLSESLPGDIAGSFRRFHSPIRTPRHLQPGCYTRQEPFRSCPLVLTWMQQLHPSI